ncbi:histidine phosphatase family protein [Paenibacillus dendritiformis]|uniref:histidine phosphatase family protein n=1 Tax=Paenibacillus dendritiformis TaxID=130049 RepID=UPI00105A5091|nr:histidine phosphatase family protein [Paenibacillus dendritiformis]TDL49207.1 histidine phosphatase family protein [Paenibacillus dendritiformis]
MNIGLVRHFKVDYEPDNRWMTSDQFNQWVERYDLSDVCVSAFLDGDLKWDVCLCSDLYRAAKTADIIYKGPVIKTAQLREIRMSWPSQSKLRLHYYVWQMIARLAWYFSQPSQEESRRESVLRARQFIDHIEETYQQSNVLIVSHGAFMKCLTQELLRRGYKGKRFVHPKNGKLYTFTR